MPSTAAPPARPAGKKVGPSPVDRAKPGSKHHLATDAGGVPLAATVTGANVPDVKQLIPRVDAIPAVAGKPGAPLKKPKDVIGDRGHDSDPHRTKLSAREIGTDVARRGEPHGSGMGIFRYVVEQSLGLLHQFRRLRTRFDKRDDVHESFVAVALCVMCFRRMVYHDYF